MEERKVRLMKLALGEAEKALAEKEVPVGCVIVKVGATKSALSCTVGEHRLDQVSATGSNKTNQSFNATRHAELVGMRNHLLCFLRTKSHLTTRACYFSHRSAGA